MGFAFSVTTGSGSLSIGLQLNFCVVVENRKATALINGRFGSILWGASLHDTKYVVEEIAAIERELIMLYQSRQASPYERSASGRAILHVRSSLVFKSYTT